jgi:hypothetical protein
VHHIQLVATVVHVEARERPPRAADRVESPVFQPAQDGRAVERSPRQLPRGFERAARCRRQAQAAELQAVAGADLAPFHIGQLQAAAAEVAGDAVGVLEARDDAERGNARLVGAGEDGHLPAADRFHFGDEFGAVFRFARRRGGEHVDVAHAHLPRQRGEAAERALGLVHRIGGEPARFGHPRPQPREHFFVEERRRRARQPLIDDQADGIGADVDHRHRTAAGDPALGRQRLSCERGA